MAYREKRRGGRIAAFKGTEADFPGVRDGFSRLHVLHPIRQEVFNPPAGEVWHTQLGELVLKENRDDGVKAELRSTNRI